MSEFKSKTLLTNAKAPVESYPAETQDKDESKFSSRFQLSAENLNICNDVSILKDLE